MGSGGGGNTESTVTQSNLPEYAQPYFENLLNRTETISQEPYIPYPGQRLADQSADTTGAYASIQDVAATGSSGLAPAGDALGSVQNIQNTLAGFTPSSITSNYQTPSAYQGATFSPNQITGATVSSNDFTGADASRYMSPYIQEVIDRQKEAAIRDFNEGQGARNTNAIRSGAFGGYRDAISRGVAERGLGTNLAGIEAAGLQSAFDRAQAQFNQDEARRLAAATSTAGYGMTAQQANQAMGMTAQQLAEQSRQYGGTLGSQQEMYAADQDLKALMADSAAREKAAGIVGAAGQLGLGAAEGYGKLATSAQTLDLAGINALKGIGSEQEAYEQQQLDIARTDFENQRDYDRQQLLFYNAILRGIPITASTDVTKYTNPNQLSQIAGMGLSGLGLYNQFNQTS